MRANAAPLATKVVLSYGVFGLPLALLAITYFVYLPRFYTDVAGLPLESLAALLLLSRLWDAFIDPLIGSLSDRSSGRFGRRKSWTLYAILPLAVSFYLLCTPSLRPEACSLKIWFTVLSVLFFLFWTMATIPYEALGAELSGGYHERTKLLGVRDAAIVLGTLLSGVFPAFLIDGGQDPATYSQLALLYGSILLIAATVFLLNTPEPKWSEAQLGQPASFFSFFEILQNKAFRILLLAFSISAFAAGVPPVLLTYYVAYVLQVDTPSSYLALYFLFGFVCLPLWIALAKRWDKKQSWMLAMAVNTLAFAGVYTLGAGDSFAFAVLVSISGIGYGASLALPSSMQADVIDYDELAFGSRREGQFIGFWSISKKLAAALAGGLALGVLAYAGYTPNQEQSAFTISILKLLYAGIPCICNIAAIFVAYYYPITQSSLEEIQKALDAKEEAA